MMNRNQIFLNWIADRLVHVHGESENVDFVLRLRDIAASFSKCESCGGLNTSCPEGCERDPKTGELLAPDARHGRSSIKKSYRAEGKNWID